MPHEFSYKLVKYLNPKINKYLLISLIKSSQFTIPFGLLSLPWILRDLSKSSGSASCEVFGELIEKGKIMRKEIQNFHTIEIWP